MRISDFAGGSAGILAPVYAGERRFTDHDNQMQQYKGGVRRTGILLFLLRGYGRGNPAAAVRAGGFMACVKNMTDVGE